MPSSLASRARHKLVTPPMLLACAAGCAAMLFALQPDAQGTLDLAKDQERDALSVAYLRVLLRSQPDDAAIRYALARNLSASGEHGEARSIIAPLALGAGPAGLDARLALLQIDRTALQQQGLADPQRPHAATRIAAQIEALLDQSLSQAALLALAQAGRELNRADLAARSFEQLASKDAAKRQHWLALAAANWLSHGAPLRAALAYQAIAELDKLPALDARKYALLALDAFMAANEGEAALRFAHWTADKLGADRTVMERLVATAQARNQAQDAQRFGRRLLALTPNSPAALEKQLDLELAANALPRALSLARRLVAIAPSAERRRRLATIAEWNAEQEAALAQWTLLARADSASPAMARALELSFARGQNDLWLELAGLASGVRALNAAEQAAMLAIAQRQPDSPRLIGCLAAYLARHPAPLDLWLALSEAQAGAGDYTAALGTLHSMPAALTGTVEKARLEALMFMRAQHPEQGLERLRAVRTLALQSDSSYWMLLGDLAWRGASRDEAVRAYRAAWASGEAPARAAERLVEAASGADEHAQAIALARAAYGRFDEPRWLLMAMDLASRAQRWDQLRELLAVADGKSPQLAHFEMYWMQSAVLARHDGRTADARNAHERALMLNPDSVAARVALLWFEIDNRDNGDGSRLDRLLGEWQGDAARDAAYWSPFAAAMLQLHRPDEALPWFERHLRHNPDDMASALQYAEALAQSVRPDDALHQRRAVYLRLRAQSDASQPAATVLPAALILPYARLMREFDSEGAAQTFLAGMIERGEQPAQARELLVASLLAQQNVGAARHWLQRARADQTTLPAWQHLALAQADNDLPAIAAIVASSAAELSKLDHIGALRRLGRNAQALAVAEAALRVPANAGNAPLRDTTMQLRTQQSKQAGLVAERRQLGGMDIRKLAVHASAPLAAGRANIQLAQATLGDSAGAQLPGNGKEDDLSASAQLPFASGEVSVTLGANRRRDDATMYAHAEWSRPLGRDVLLRLDGAVNTIGEESTLLRVVGTKDRLGGALSVNLDHDRYARIDLGGQRYATRRGARLGSGYRIEGELGALLFKQGKSQGMSLHARLSASREQNRLAARLPVALGNVAVPAGTDVADAVPAQYGWAGAGTTLSFGDQNARPRRVHGSVDALVGKQWPERSAAYNVRAVLGVPLASGGALKTEAFQGNVQGGVGAARNRGIRLSYEHTF